MFKQFEIQDENKRIIAGWASVMIKDLQGDIVPVDELERAMYSYMDRGGHIVFGHQNKPIGKVLRWEVKEHPETKKQGLWIVAKIFDDYPIDDEAWEMIKRGLLKGFSIGGAGNPKKMVVKENGQTKEVDVIGDVQLLEISVVEEPANPLAKIEYVNYFAKGNIDDMRVFEKRDDGWYELTKSGDARKIADTDDEMTKMLRKMRVKEITETFKSKGIKLNEEDVEIYMDATSACRVCKSFVDEYISELSYIVFGDDMDNLNEVQRSVMRQIEERLKELIAITLAIDKRDENYKPKTSKEIREEGLGVSYGSNFDGNKTVEVDINVEANKSDVGKRMRKVKKGMKKEVKKSKVEKRGEYVEIRKPFAGFENFDDCVKKMKEWGYDDESARKICGSLYWEYEGKKEFKKLADAIDKVWETYIEVMGLEDKVKMLVDEGKEIIEKEEDLMPKKWFERCMDELNNARLCGWIYWHHLKPYKPEDKEESDKPSTREARRRKRKWLRERGES